MPAKSLIFLTKNLFRLCWSKDSKIPDILDNISLFLLAMTHILNLHQCLFEDRTKANFPLKCLRVKVTMTLSTLPSKWTQWKFKLQRQHNCMANMKDVGQPEQVTPFPQSLGSLQSEVIRASWKPREIHFPSKLSLAQGTAHIRRLRHPDTDDTASKKPYKLIYFMNLHVETLSLPWACYNFLPGVKQSSMKEKTPLRIWSKTQGWILLSVFIRDVVLRLQEKHLQLLDPINLRATEQVSTESLQKYFNNFTKCSNERPQALWRMRNQSDHAEQAHSNLFNPCTDTA